MKLIQQVEVILQEVKQPLHSREIARLVHERFPIQKNGDLERQIYSALDRDIRKDARASKFTKVTMGTFCLNEYSVGHDVKPGYVSSSGSEQAKPVENEDLKYPVLRFSSPNHEKLSPAARALPISNLGLGARPSSALQGVGLETIGAFSDAIRSGLGRMGNFGKEAHAETVKAVLALSDAVLDDGSIDWLVYAQKRGFPVLPDAEGLAMADFLPVLPEIIQKAIESQFDDSSYWTILEKRWLVPSEKSKTLQELATALGLTRSRVQQQEALIFDALRPALLDDNYDQLRFRFRPEVAADFRRTKAYFSEVGQTAWKKSVWLEEFASVHRLDVGQIGDYGDLLIELLSFHTRKTELPDGESLVFEDSCPAIDVKKTLDVVEAIHKALEKECLGLDAVDLAGRIAKNERTRIHLDEVPTFVALCPTVEVVAGEVYRLKFPFLKSRADEAVRVLAENGKPMTREDIFRLINMQATKPVAEIKSVVSQMMNDKRTCPIGKTGVWALAEWGAETRTIPDVIEDILTKNGSPLEVKEITTRLQALRPASPVSVVMYLDLQRDRFYKVATGFYGLTAWVKGGVNIQPRGKYHRTKPLQSDLIIERAVQLLEARSDKCMPMVELVKLLEAEFKISRNSIYGPLSQATEIETVAFPDKLGKLCRLKRDTESSPHIMIPDSGQSHEPAMPASFKTQQEEAEALYNQAMEFIVPIPSEDQKQKTFDLLQKAVDLGHLEAYVDLYYCYVQGSGPVDDEALGVRWLSKAAEAGLVRAQAVLGAHWGQKWFENNEDSAREAAYFWTEKAAAQGDFLSAQTLEMYTNANRDTLVKEFLQALHQASLGDPSAQQTVSMMYQVGIGVAQDQEKADYWEARFGEQKPAYIEMLKQKAEQGDETAACALSALTTTSLIAEPERCLAEIRADIEKMKNEDPAAYKRLMERASKIPDFGPG